MTPKWMHWPAASGTPWTPEELGSLQAWLDASDANDFTLSGSQIISWADKSGNSIDATDAVDSSNAAITTRRPTRDTTNTLNSKAVVSFDGTEFMSLLAPDMLRNRTDALVAVVYRMGSLSTNTSLFVLISANASAANYRVLIGTSGENPSMFRAAGNGPDADTSSADCRGMAADTNWHVHVAHCRWTSGELVQVIDGDAVDTKSYQTTNATSDTALNTTHDVWQTIGGRSRSNTNTLTMLPANSRVAEIVVAAKSSGTFTTGERQKLEGYLAWKWGLEGNLPVGHPYENAAP